MTIKNKMCIRDSYKEEFQKEYDTYYDEEYDRVAKLMKFDYCQDDGVAASPEDTNT